METTVENTDILHNPPLTKGGKPDNRYKPPRYTADGALMTVRTSRSKKKLPPRKIEIYKAEIEKKKKKYNYSVKTGGPTKYDPDFHPHDCLRMGREGYFAVEMAAEWDVHLDTVYEWVKVWPNFSESYKRAQSLRTAWLLKQGKSGLFNSKESSLNSMVWGKMMHYDGQNTDERTLFIPGMAECNTLDEMTKCAIQAYSNQTMTAREAFIFMQMLSVKAGIEEKTEIRKMLEEIKEKQDSNIIDVDKS